MLHDFIEKTFLYREINVCMLREKVLRDYLLHICRVASCKLNWAERKTRKQFPFVQLQQQHQQQQNNRKKQNYNQPVNAPTFKLMISFKKFRRRVVVAVTPKSSVHCSSEKEREIPIDSTPFPARSSPPNPPGLATVTRTTNAGCIYLQRIRYLYHPGTY